MIAKVGVLLLAVTLGGSAHWVGEVAQKRLQSTEPSEELVYLPEGRFLRMLSFGHRNFMSDMVWLRAIQYYGEHRLTDRNYDGAERLFRSIYTLDPSFIGATRFGCLVLSQDAGNPQGAIRMLEQAASDHPDRWEYPFDQGFIYQTVVRDLEEAGAAYRRASELPEAPRLAARLAGLSYAKLGDRSTARAVWEQVLVEADNDMMREIADRSLRTLAMEEGEEVLTTAVRSFVEMLGRQPTNWGELLKFEFLEEIPIEPFGGQYFLDPTTNQIFATTGLDRKMSRVRNILTMRIQEYFQAHGSYPESFGSLLDEGRIDTLPDEPLGVALQYDPEAGTVVWDPPWPATEPETRGGESS